MGDYATFIMPNKIYYGENSFKKVGDEAAKCGNTALIVSDPIMEDLGYVQRCQDYLDKKDIDSIVFTGIETEPTDQYVHDALKLFQRDNCDCIISLGGGSCIDTAKAVAILATNGGKVDDYLKNDIPVPAIPHIAIPTTAGTGSEATDVTVITNTETKVKMMIKHALLMPKIAIVDPVLTYSSPKTITASTGIDSLTHAIEAYLSSQSHPFTDTMALSAMDYIINNIESAYFKGDDNKARKNMSIGSLKAGIAFSNASVALVHGMSRPIGALFGVPHGFSNAMLLPAVLEFNKNYCIKRLADIGKFFQNDENKLAKEELAELAIQSIKKLCLKLNIPNLRNWGISEKEFYKSISKMADDAIDSGSPENNPRRPSKKDIEKLYQVSYDYDFSRKYSQVNF